MGCTSSHITDMVDSEGCSTSQQGEENRRALERVENEQNPSVSMQIKEDNNALKATGRTKDPPQSPPLLSVNEERSCKEGESAGPATEDDPNGNKRPMGVSVDGGRFSDHTYDLSKMIDQEVVERGSFSKEALYGEEGRVASSNNEDDAAEDGRDGSVDYGRSYHADDDFDNSFARLPQQEKIKLLGGLLEEFNAVSEDPTDLGDLLPLLAKLFSVVLHEHNAFVLHQYFLLMVSSHSMEAFLRVLYHNRTSCDCLLLCVRLLLFFFVNSDNSKDSIRALLHSHGVSVLVVVLQEFADAFWLFRSTLCELFSLVYMLSQNEHFCTTFVEAGGLSVLHAFLQLIVQHQVYALLDPPSADMSSDADVNTIVNVNANADASTNANVNANANASINTNANTNADTNTEGTGTPSPARDREQRTNAKNLLYYISYILASLSRFQPCLHRMARLDFVSPCVLMLDHLICTLSASDKEESADSVLDANDADSVIHHSSVEEEDAGKGKHAVTSSSLSVRLLDGSGAEDDVDRLDYRRLLSFSNDHMVVIMNEADDESLGADAASSVYCVVSTLLLFLQTAMGHHLVQLELIECRGLETLAKLLSLSPSATLATSASQTLSILYPLITSHGLPNNVLSAHHVEELLLLLLCVLTDDTLLAADHAVDGKPMDAGRLTRQALQLISYQCKMSGVSRELIDTECLLSRLAVVLKTYPLSSFMEPAVDCLLSLSDLNEKNLEVIAASQVFESLFPSFLAFLSDEMLMVKISMLLAINSNFYGFDAFFGKSNLMRVLKEIMIKYPRNGVIMQNCLLCVYYLSHLSVLSELDSTMYTLLSAFVKENSHDPGIVQRFSKICHKLKEL